jgi:hypothetical protein
MENSRRLWAYRSGPHGESLLKPKALCSLDYTRVLIVAQERNTLRHISAVHNCPILAEMPDGSVSVLGQGYHAHAGGRLIMGGELP